MRELLLGLLLVFGSSGIYSQEVNSLIIKSKVLNEDRTALIGLPPNYDPEKKYLSIYLLDGEWNFDFVSSVILKLGQTGDIPEAILIGIVNTNRNRDLTPAGSNDNPERFGGAGKFLEFISSELIPEVESEYSVHNHRILAGHSFGGLFTVYTMMAKPGLFESYISLSPSLGRNSEQQVKIGSQFFSSDNPLPKSLFIAIANEGGDTESGSTHLNDIIMNSEFDFHYNFKTYPDESHASITAVGFLEGIKFTFKGYNPETTRGIDNVFKMEEHYTALSERFGYEIQPSEDYYYRFVREQIAERDLDYAFYILQRYNEQYPSSSQLYLCYADAHLLNGDLATAREYYVKLKATDPSNENLDRLIKALK